MLALPIVLLATFASAEPSPAKERVIKLEKGADGHFVVNVKINGVDAGEFLVDTGATSVAIPPAIARKCKVEGPFQRIRLNTANGVAQGLLGTADVGAGGITFPDVDVVIAESGRALLGMSFLSQFDLRTTSSTLELRPLPGGDPVVIADIEPSQIKLAALALPPQIGDARCAYEEAGEVWRCDEHVHEEHDGAASIGATSGLKVRIELYRSAACLTGVRIGVAAEGKSVIVPWGQSLVVADGVKLPSPRASIGRADKGAELSYTLRLGDRCVSEDWLTAHETSWSLPLLVDNKAARVKWMHRWTPTTATESALLETMTQPEFAPRAPEPVKVEGSFPLWTGVGGATSLLVAGAGGAIGAAVASSSKLEVGLISGAVVLGVSAPLLIVGGYLLDTGSEQDEAPPPDPNELIRKKRAAYERQLAN